MSLDGFILNFHSITYPSYKEPLYARGATAGKDGAIKDKLIYTPNYDKQNYLICISNSDTVL